MKTLKILFLLIGIIFLKTAFSIEIEGPPAYPLYDENGVNLNSGRVTISKSDLSIGVGDLSLLHTIQTFDGLFTTGVPFQDNYTGSVLPVVREFPAEHIGFIHKSVSYGDMSAQFHTATDNVNATYVDEKQNGASLVSQGGNWLYTHNDGTKITFAELPDGKGNAANNIIYPNGFEVNVHHTFRTDNNGRTWHRKQSVTTNNGLQLHYRYASDLTSGPFSESEWRTVSEIVAINNTVEYCDPTSVNCSLSNNWPSVTYTHSNTDLGQNGGDFTITEADGRRSIYTHELFCAYGAGTNPCDINNSLISKITDTTSASVVTRSFEYGNEFICNYQWLPGTCAQLRQGVVFNASQGGKNWDYVWTASTEAHAPPFHQSNGPFGAIQVVKDRYYGVPTYYSNDKQDITMTFEANLRNRIETVKHQGVDVNYTYDSLGNITQSRTKASSQSGLADIVTTANYQNNCANIKTQKKPAWIRDARGNQTDITYHCASGKIATVTLPANEQGVRAQTRYVYQQKYARYKNSSGVMTNADTPIWVLTAESSCALGNSSGNGCALSNDEVLVEYEFNDNLWVKGTVVSHGSESRRTCLTYDDIGNKLSETAPKANLTTCP